MMCDLHDATWSPQVLKKRTLSAAAGFRDAKIVVIGLGLGSGSRS